MSSDQNGRLRKPRPVQRPRVPPGALRDLKDLLYELYLEAGTPSLDDITAAVAADDELAGAPGRDTVRRILAETTPSAQPDVVAVATVLARAACWDERETAARVRSLWVQARMTVPAGTPVGELTDPFALEVHRPIDVMTSAEVAELALLPPYVRREHDAQLSRVVARSVAGSNGIAVLVGGSSTGKTRACWEAVHKLPDGWRVWHPIYPDRPEAALEELPRVGPRTVVWLNDAQFYLLTDDPAVGERIAAGLRELLRDPGRGPVLVLATLWPSYWEALTIPASAGPDRHGHARALMEGALIEVPEAFTGAAMASLELAAQADSRLAQAAEHAADNQVTQYLAGVPVLLERYRAAPSVAKAVIYAAMDARRLGHGPALPQTFLAAVAPLYLTEREWEQAGEDWLDRALAYTAAPCNGIGGPLIQIRPRPVLSGAIDRPAGHPRAAEEQPHYRLADYLEQVSEHERADLSPPTGFWDAAVSCPVRASAGLGEAAREAGLFRHAAQLWKNALSDNAWAGGQLIRLLTAVSPQSADDAATWIIRHVPLSDATGIASLLTELLNAGQQEAAGMLLARDPVRNAAFDDPIGITALLRALREAAEEEMCEWDLVHALAGRAATGTPVDDRYLWFFEELVAELWRAGEREALSTVAARAAADAPVEDAWQVRVLLRTLGKAGESQAIHTLAVRAAAAMPLAQDGIHWLVEELQASGEPQAIRRLVDRNLPAAVALESTLGVCCLLQELRKAGEDDAVHALAARAAAEGPLDDLFWLHTLLDDLCEWGEKTAAQALAAHAAAEAPVDDPGLIFLFESMRNAGEQQAFRILAARAARAVPLGTEDITGLIWVLRGSDEREAMRALAARIAADLPVEDQDAIVAALYELRDAGEQEAARILAVRAARAAPVADPDKVSGLFAAVRSAGAAEMAHVLAVRAASSVAVDDPAAISSLVTNLRMAGAPEAAHALAVRAVPAVNLHDAGGLARLIYALWRPDEQEARHVLAVRAAADVPLDGPSRPISGLIDALRHADEHEAAAMLTLRMQEAAAVLAAAWTDEADDEETVATPASSPAPIDWGGYGYEPDGRPSPPWDWFDLT
jgi:hypothetical protein